MSDPKDHLDPKEATEAKLCAYLENELAPAERAEIEQHLAANPQHRQLLADLARTRDWVRSIPSESSPIDLAEIFQGQVERSMLLDDPADSSRMMIRMPQFLMVAAIMLLTVGLGVVVVVMLKGPKADKNFSMGPASSKPIVPASPTTEAFNHEMDRDVLAKAKDTDAGGLASATPTLPLSAPAAVAAAPPGVGAFGFGGGGGGGGRGGEEVKALADGARRDRSTQLDLDADAVKSKLLQSGYRMPMGQKTVCFVVSADSPPATDEQVRGFFTRHQLAFDDAITGKHESPPGAYIAVGNQDLSKVASVSAGSTNNATTQSLALNVTGNAGNNTGSNAGNVSTGNAQTAPNELSQSQGDNNLQNGSRNSLGQKQQLNADSQSLYSNKPAIPVLSPTTGPAGEQIYVAYGLTRLQFNLLSASLSTDNLSQSVKQLTLAEHVPVDRPTTLPTGAVTKGQTLTVTVAQLVGPGIDKTNVVKVADDGTISLPMIDALPAAGAQPGELERKIADKYREANLIQQATVTVAEAVAPSTQPIAAATQPTTTPSSQPAVAEITPATKPASDTVDVVVVIEKSTTVLPPK